MKEVNLLPVFWILWWFSWTPKLMGRPPGQCWRLLFLPWLTYSTCLPGMLDCPTPSTTTFTCAGWIPANILGWLYNPEIIVTIKASPFNNSSLHNFLLGFVVLFTFIIFPMKIYFTYYCFFIYFSIYVLHYTMSPLCSKTVYYFLYLDT